MYEQKCRAATTTWRHNKCPLDIPYEEWAYLAPLSWAKMLWRTLQVTGFQVHLKYDELLYYPRCGEMVVMEFVMSMGLDKEDLMSMSKVKGRLGVIFLSDMTTADGKHLESFGCDPYVIHLHRISRRIHIQV